MKIRRLSRRVTQIYDDALAPHGLTIGQMGLLALLRQSQGVSIKTLAERLSADASTISRQIKPLVDAEWVALEADPDDRRARVIRLTKAGADRRRQAQPGWQAAQDRIADLLGSGRRAALHHLLDDAHNHLQLQQIDANPKG